MIFPELVEGYEWWGYCDCDLIFGDLGHFLPAPLAGDCERVYRHGHLTILRNRVDVNRVALNNLPGVRVSWRDVFRHKCSAHYDESLFFEALLKDAGLTTFEEVTYADLDRFELRFRMREGNEWLDVDHFEKRSDGVLLAQMAQGGYVSCPMCTSSGVLWVSRTISILQVVIKPILMSSLTSQFRHLPRRIALATRGRCTRSTGKGSWTTCFTAICFLGLRATTEFSSKMYGVTRSGVPRSHDRQ